MEEAGTRRRGVLRRRAGEYLQLVLPRQFHRMVYRELHEEMGHLRWERTFQLAKTVLLAL